MGSPLDTILNTNPAPPTYSGPGYAATPNTPAAQSANQQFAVQQAQQEDAPPVVASPNIPLSPKDGGPDLSRTYQSPVMQPPNSPTTGGWLKQALQRFAYYGSQAALKHVNLPTDDELQMHQSEMAARQAQIDKVKLDSQLVPATDENGNLLLNPFGQPTMLTRGQNAALLKQREANKGKAAATAATQAGLNSRVAPKAKLGQQYLEALQNGDEEGAQKVLDSLHELSQADAKPVNPAGKIDPIILAQIGPPPDPTTNPEASKRWGQAAARIKSAMGTGPRVTSVMVGGVPKTIPTASLPAGGLETPQYNPQVAARKAGAIAFGTGTEGDQIQSFRAFLGHANDLSDFSGQFTRSNSRWANIPLNKLRENASDDPQIAAYLAKIDPVKKEFESFLLNNRALYESDRKTADRILADTMPPSQMQSALRSFAHTATIRMGALNEKYKDIYGTDNPTMIDPETKRILGKFGQTDTLKAYQTGTGKSSGGNVETRQYQGSTYTRKGPNQPWVRQ